MAQHSITRHNWVMTPDSELGLEAPFEGRCDEVDVEGTDVRAVGRPARLQNQSRRHDAMQTA